MTNTNGYRFRLYTSESFGAYTSVQADSQAEAEALLNAILAPWEYAAPLHGPCRSPLWFD